MKAVSFALTFCALALLAGCRPKGVAVGSKKFTESVILGELAIHLVRRAGSRPVPQRELGGTRILWNALVRGDIDVYPDYTGTIREEILAGRNLRGPQDLRTELARHGVLMSRPLGFNNTYIIGMKETLAERLGIRKISDLRRHPELKLGFSSEFMDRADGWPSLRERYRLPHRDVIGLDHDLAYRGLAEDDILATDLYSTDAEIRYYGLRALDDDLGHFPAYHAVYLYRADLPRRAPEVVEAILGLEGTITAQQMMEMNGRAKLDKESEIRVAADFLDQVFPLNVPVVEEGPAARLMRLTFEHVFLVAVSMAGAIFLAVPLGILSARHPTLGQAILGSAGILQTIPSLALLVFMIPLFGLGWKPAVAALFLYSLLPIVRNTYAGLNDLPVAVRESAEALGLPPAARLRLVELPNASRVILAGIKTSAVINIGTATLAALIGAGGYGQPIITGIRKDDTGLILQGAVPAALLALLVQALFELAERFLVPKGLRLKPQDG